MIVGRSEINYLIVTIVGRLESDDLWSSADIRAKSPGFPLFDLHLLVVKRIPLLCSEIIAHSSQSQQFCSQSAASRRWVRW